MLTSVSMDRQGVIVLLQLGYEAVQIDWSDRVPAMVPKVRSDWTTTKCARGRGGIITQACILAGNPDDASQLVPSLERHTEQFGHSPHLVASDGKFATPTNEQTAALQSGVVRVVLPQPGRKTPTRVAHQRQRWFQRGRNWHAGIEGRINGLKRRHGLDRCRNHGDDGMQRLVGWGVIAHALRKIAEHQVERVTGQA
jgi:hypothetical protein